MRVISFNANGIRSACRKGFFDWAARQNPDILCLQELKAHDHQLPDEAAIEGLRRYVCCAEKPGYAGVALYSRQEPDDVHFGFGSVDPDTNWRDMDVEGRFVMVDFAHLSIASLYIPSGSSSAARQAIKMSFLERFLPFVRRLKARGRELLFCGDVNIAHQRLDIKNWRSNQKNSGFLPEERAWFSSWMEAGFVDVFRHLHPETEAYSWWSNRGRARENNVGWRIDYHIATPALANTAREAWIHDRGERFSDHAPIVADFET